MSKLILRIRPTSVLIDVARPRVFINWASISIDVLLLTQLHLSLSYNVQFTTTINNIMIYIIVLSTMIIIKMVLSPKQSEHPAM